MPYVMTPRAASRVRPSLGLAITSAVLGAESHFNECGPLRLSFEQHVARVVLMYGTNLDDLDPARNVMSLLRRGGTILLSLV